MPTLENKCTCKSPFQDKEYGKDIRLFNLNDKDGAKCTVCGTTIKVSSEKKRGR